MHHSVRAQVVVRLSSVAVAPWWSSSSSASRIIEHSVFATVSIEFRVGVCVCVCVGCVRAVPQRVCVPSKTEAIDRQIKHVSRTAQSLVTAFCWACCESTRQLKRLSQRDSVYACLFVYVVCPK